MYFSHYFCYIISQQLDSKISFYLPKLNIPIGLDKKTNRLNQTIYIPDDIGDTA